MWYYNNVGGARCPIVDTFWQTETGGHMITPLPGVTPLVPGSCTLPFPGIQAAIVDETGNDVEWGKGGFLVVKKPWPSMIRTIYGDPERYKKSYFPVDFGGNLYLAGDGAMRDAKTGYFTIMGRIDDVLNVSGHRMGTMEIESALVSNPLVAEAAVVGRPDDLTGEAICAFVVLKQARPSPKRRRRSPPNCATGSARKSARSPSPRTSASARTCPRRAPARSCGACCAAWPRTRRSPRTCPRWRIRRFWIS
jgi:acetyl-CoA synthetase